MKKVFWTSIVWIILICGFTLYMKWFNQPLAEKVWAFIAPSFHCPVLDCDVPVCEPSECTECITSCDECTATETQPVECNCPAGMVVTDADICTNVFEKLEQIDKKLSGTTAEKTEEDLLKEFEEFKARRESKE